MGVGNIKSMSFYKMGAGNIKSKICVAHFPVTASVFPVTAPIFCCLCCFPETLPPTYLSVRPRTLARMRTALAEVGSL